MSNVIKKIKKSIMEDDYLYESFQNTIYGSLICSVNALNENHLSDKEIFKRSKKAKFPFVDDKYFIKKTLEAVDMKYEDALGKPLAIFTSTYNALIAPYVFVEDEETGEMKIKALSYKRNMEIPRTCYDYKTAKIIDWDSQDESEEVDE